MHHFLYKVYVSSIYLFLLIALYLLAKINIDGFHSTLVFLNSWFGNVRDDDDDGKGEDNNIFYRIKYITVL